MDSQSALTAGFHVKHVANGAAVAVELRDANLSYDVSDSLKPRLKTTLEELLAEGHLGFLIDVRAVELIDSCGAGLLVALHHQVAAAGGALAIVGANPFVFKVLRMMRLDRFLSCHEDQEKALRVVADPV